MLKNNFIIGFIVGVIITGAMGVFAYNSHIEATYNNIKIKLNDDYIDTGTDEPFIAGGRTYIPARYVAEAMGGDVSWDAENSIVNINTSWYLKNIFNTQKDTILLKPAEYEQLYLRLSEIIVEYLSNDYSISDETYNEMLGNQMLYDGVTDVATPMAFVPPAFGRSFSDFWTKERVEKYSDIFAQLNECFNINYDDESNEYTIRLK